MVWLHKRIFSCFIYWLPCSQENVLLSLYMHVRALTTERPPVVAYARSSVHNRTSYVGVYARSSVHKRTSYVGAYARSSVHNRTSSCRCVCTFQCSQQNVLCRCVCTFQCLQENVLLLLRMHVPVFTRERPPFVAYARSSVHNRTSYVGVYARSSVHSQQNVLCRCVCTFQRS
jgi:hypothetical protein